MRVELGISEQDQIAMMPMTRGEVALKKTAKEIFDKAREEYQGCVSATPDSYYYGAPSGCVGEVRRVKR